MTPRLLGEPNLPESPDPDATSRLSLAELQQALHTVDPGAILVLPRILRRVIKEDRRLAGFGLRVPHRKCYVIACEALHEIIDAEDLGVTAEFVWPERVALLARPDPRKLAETPAGDVLLRLWRLLFHAGVHRALDEQAAKGGLGPATVFQRIQQIGTAPFEEIRLVLGQEDMLLPPRSDEAIYKEFVAVFLELRHFAPELTPRYFPGLENPAVVDAVIRQDVDAETLFRATRPPGAQESNNQQAACGFAAAPDGQDSSGRLADPLPGGEGNGNRLRSYMRKAQRAASLGNVVRAALWHARAERCSPVDRADSLRIALRRDIAQLSCRLQAALASGDAESREWHEPLVDLSRETPRGIWTPEARLLYDLQKVCVDHERETYTVDLIEWALSRGRRPIKRALPNERDVLMLKHLRSAAKRVAAVRLSDARRRPLAELLRAAVGRIETRLRDRLRPKISGVLDEVGLLPRNVPERVARKKLVEGLLDQLAERGFLTMGDLRDAISGNNLKLPDLAEPLDLIRGDPLLRADRRLAVALDGVYRRGEVYLRWMQRLSSMAFGTATGRFLTRFAVVPFGGAYVSVAFARHLSDLLAGVEEPGGVAFVSPLVLGLGFLLLFVVNSAAFRHAAAALFKRACRGFRAFVIEPIRRVVESPWLQEIIRSRTFRLTIRVGIKPLAWTFIAWKLLPAYAEEWQNPFGVAASIFLAVNLALNSRIGRNTEEVVADAIVQGWHRFGLRLITGVFWFIIDVFNRILEAIERLLYSVDEWLRFKSGEGRLVLVGKALLGTVWFFISYVLRFAVNVLIEPQLNPIKHFPVVTVSHKLLIPLYKPLAELLEVRLGMATFPAWFVVTTTSLGLPGVFGFLVWELRENWRLYAANRRPSLFPVVVGSHGETMGRLLRTGFHSGTVPKRFAKLRRAERRARRFGNWQPVRKHQQALHHVEAAVRRYIEREFFAILAESGEWHGEPITLDEVRLGTNSVRLAFGRRGAVDSDLHIALEVESGWLVAGVTRPGWVDRLPEQQRQVLVVAILGLYESSGVDMVREHIESLFPPPAPAYDIAARGLVVWPDGAYEVEAFYDLHEGPWIAPQSVRGLARRSLPTIERRRLLLSEAPVAWDWWVSAWGQNSGETRATR